MNTYRIYLLDTTNVESPVVSSAFFQATKYNDAWTGARAVLSGKITDRFLFAEADCKTKIKIAKADPRTVVKILDCTPRNKKLDKATLADILADESLNDAQRLEKIAALNR